MKRMLYPAVIVAFSVYVASTTPVAAQLIPRTPLAKPATITKPTFESRLTVKFRDDLKVRAVNGDVVSQVGADLANVQAVKAQFALTFQQSVRLPQETLDFLETRAAQRSGVAQPDLGAMMVVVGTEETLEAAAQALLGLDEIEWAQFTMLNPEPPDICETIPSQGPFCDPPVEECCDIHPPTCEFFADRGPVCRDLPGIICDYHGPDPGLDMAYAWTYGARGAGIQIADCEYGYILGSEDLCDINNGPDMSCLSNEDHGTAVLGMMVGLDNGYGWTGLVPDATVWFFPERVFDSESGGCRHRRAEAIAGAVAAVEAGDIILLEMQTSIIGEFNWGPAELDLEVWTLTHNATASGIIVVAAAGNGNEDLDSEEYFCGNCAQCPEDYGCRGDSGAIIVGAGTADTSHDKLGFSTYGSRVNVQGWGQMVFTLGNLLGHDNIEFNGDERQRYMYDFSGTSSASPFIASAAAALQSLAEAELCYRLTPAEMRQLLIDTGIPQGSGGHIGPFPNMAAAIPALGQFASDCNGNEVPDECDLADCSGQAWCDDCNENGTLDECDIAAQPGLDCYNVDGIPDECQPHVPKGKCCLFGWTVCADNVTACWCTLQGGSYMGDGLTCGRRGCQIYGPQP